MSTAHPVIRFPLFLMGMLGGLQVLRAHEQKDTFEDPNLGRNLLHTILPWSYSSTQWCCIKKKKETRLKPEGEKQAKVWRKRVDFNAFLYVGFLLTLTFTKLALDINFPERTGMRGTQQQIYILS